MASGEPSSTAGVGGGILDRPKTKRKHQHELQDFANTLEYRNGDGELIGVVFPTVAPWPVVRSSPIWSSSALFDEQRAWEGRVAHRDLDRGGCGVREGLQGTVHRRRRLEREKMHG